MLNANAFKVKKIYKQERRIVHPFKVLTQDLKELKKYPDLQLQYFSFKYR